MLLKTTDDYGNAILLTSDKVRHIMDLLDNYIKGPYFIRSAWISNKLDPNGRIDIEVVIQGEELISQKLLILKDEVIDGNAFHKRYSEFYN